MRLLTTFVLIFFSHSMFALTLQQVRQMALDNSKQLKASWYEVQKYRNDYRSAVGANLLPQIDFIGAYKYTHNNYPKSSGASGEYFSDFTDAEKKLGYQVLQIVSDMSTPSGDQTALTARVQISQILYSGGKVLTGLDVAKKAYNSLEKRYILTKQEIVFNTTKLYYQLILAQKALEIQKQAKGLATKNLQQTESMYAQGVVSEYQKLRASLEVSKIKTSIVEAESAVSVAKQALENVIGGSIDKATDKLIAPQVTELSLDEAISIGIKKRLELELSAIGLEIENKTLSIKKKEFYPNVLFQAAYQKYSLSTDKSVQTSNFGDSYEYGLLFTLPLFTGLSRGEDVKSQTNKLKMAQLEHTRLQENILLQIRSSYNELKASQKNYQTQKQNLALSEKAYSIAETRYNNGVSSQLELIDAQLQKSLSLLEYENSVFRLIVGDFQLKKAIGEEL